jgi:prepilin-type N-terminal cleavage/methylation domain-containing protein
MTVSKPRPVSGTRRSPARGLTLLEMLVTLVIVSLVVTILSQAMSQLSRIERLLDGGRLGSTAVALRAEWVRSALAALLPGTTQAEQLQGSARELTALSSEVPRWPVSGLGRLHLRLRTDDRTGSTALELLPEAGQDRDPAVLMRWAGGEGRFMYLDAQDRWIDRWPGLSTTAIAAAPGSPALLPRAVALETGPGGPGFLIAVPLAAPTGAPTRAVLESM